MTEDTPFDAESIAGKFLLDPYLDWATSWPIT